MKKDRRNFLQSSLFAATAFGLGANESVTADSSAKKKYRKIAVEEGFHVAEISAVALEFIKSEAGQRAGFGPMQGYYRDLLPDWTRLALDVGEGRLQEMDNNGIDMQLMVLSAGAVQLMEPDIATEMAAIANDHLAVAVRSHPSRFAGLAAIAPQKPQHAAQELERSVTQLGLKGAIINSNVRGEYLDDKKFWPVFEAAADLDVPIYLHPSFPSPAMLEPYKDYALLGPMAGFSAETSLHALRLIMSGLFDEIPRLRIVLGHLGEGIPFFLDRIDRAHTNTINHRLPRLKRLPSEYFLDNFVITTSGMNSPKVVMFCIDVLGIDRVLFALDYPYEKMMPDATALDDLPLSTDDMEKLFHGNSERVFDI